MADSTINPAKKLIVIAGPTASGKTSLAINVAKALRASVISADSRQCYQGMTIGTACPTLAEREGVPHYFLDCLSVTETVSAAAFERRALEWLSELYTQSDYAVLCGGSGLYIKALLEGMDRMPPVDPDISKEVNELYQLHGIPWLQHQVQEEDPEGYAEVDVHNPARLLRLLLFKRSTGQSILRYRQRQAKPRPFETHAFGLELPRETLYGRIDKRVVRMMEAGLEAEARALYPLRDCQSLHTVGYTELFDYFDGKTDLDKAVSLIQQHTRNFAKRQFTWFRRQQALQWLDAEREEENIETICRIATGKP